jgi:hypothetical protein
MKNKSIHHDEGDEVTVSVPITILYRSLATKKLLKEEQTTITLALDQRRLEQLQGIAHRSGETLVQLLFRLVANQLSGHYHNDQDSPLQAELEALRQEHGEFETFIQPNGNIHLHTRTPRNDSRL